MLHNKQIHMNKYTHGINDIAQSIGHTRLFVICLSRVCDLYQLTVT